MPDTSESTTKQVTITSDGLEHHAVIEARNIQNQKNL